VRAVVLVGGEGTRLRPLTATVPKQMLPVAEVAMIERVLAHLAAHGVESVVLSLGYRPDAFRSAFPDGTCAGVRLDYAIEPTPLDTAGAIRFAALEAGVDGTFLVVNGDVLTDLDVGALVAFHRESAAQATISLTPVDDPTGFGVVPTDAAGRVEAFIEKPPAASAGPHSAGPLSTNMVNAGYYVLEPAVLERIPGGRRVNIERETFPAMAAEGVLYALGSPAYWHDTGTPERFLQANADLLSGVRPGVPAPGAIELRPGVWVLGEVGEAGGVGPHSLLGTGVVVEPGATVADSVLGAGCRVGPGAHVSGSVVLPGTRIGARATVERSLLGRQVVVGADAKVVGLSVVGDGVTVESASSLDGARR